MFVDIKEFKGALEVENLLTPFKRGKAEITPEVCQEVLEATNYPRNIRDMLNCILKLPAEKQAGFKAAVLNTFDNREQPDEIWDKGKELASAGGYEAEFGENSGIIKAGTYLMSGVGADRCFATLEEKWYEADLSPYRKMAFLGEEIDLSFAKNIPEELDLSRCRSVYLCYCDLAGMKKLKLAKGAAVNFNEALHIPADLDVSQCNSVEFDCCDLTGIKLKFAKGAAASFSETQNLPKDLNVSMCSNVDFSYCDLSEVDELKFADGADVYLSGATNFPADLDVSMCSYVGLDKCNLAGTNFKFRDGARVNLSGAANIPADLDVSMCSYVNLNQCNLAGVKLKFADKAKACLRDVKNLSGELDISQCREAQLLGCDLNNVEILRFKNRQQVGKTGVKIPDGWKGRLLFANEKEKPKPKGKPAKAVANGRGGR